MDKIMSKFSLLPRLFRGRLFNSRFNLKIVSLNGFGLLTSSLLILQYNLKNNIRCD